jgi:hypothetical protein
VVPEQRKSTANRYGVYFPRIPVREDACTVDYNEAESAFMAEAQQDIARDLARFYDDKMLRYPVRKVRNYSVDSYGSGICPYCHQPYWVPFCRPVVRVEEGPKHFDFPASTVVDANPNRAELTE